MNVVSRRKFLYQSSAFFTGILGGCCSVSKGIIQSAPLSSTTSLFDSSGNQVKDARVPVIDAHAHFFNASDINAIGYLSGPIMTDLPLDPNLREILRILVRVLEGVGRTFPPSAIEEWEWLNSVESKMKKTGVSDGSSGQNILREEFSKRDDLIVEMLAKRLSNTDFLERYYAQVNSLLIAPLDVTEKVSIEELIRRDISYEPGVHALGYERALGQAAFKEKHPSGLLGFLASMFRYRLQNVYQHWVGYSRDSKETKTVHACGAMVDFDRWLDGCDEPYSPIENQILLFERIAKISGGYLVPLVSFNPWTALKKGEQYKSVIADAIRGRGFRGAKIYPQIGYAPGGNGNNQYSGGRGTPDPVKIQEQLNWLYRLCLKYDVPIMAHADNSKGKIPQYSNLGSPEDWTKVAEQSEFKYLKVNAGHFGHQGSGWNSGFKFLMRNHINFHADTGFWDELMEAEPSSLERVTSILNDERISSKLMHGSDWFMLTSKRTDWYEYNDKIYGVMKSLINEGSLSAQGVRDYFYGNAASLFKLA